MSAKTTWIFIVIYATAMAWVEAAVVVYLRTLLDRIQPFQRTPLPHLANFGSTELIREAATLMMLFAVGWLAGNTTRKRLGYSLIAFGIWDIFYYVFLLVICGWPKSLFDWDVLFLIPLPWWGPVLAPTLIAVLMVIWGTTVTQRQKSERNLRRYSSTLCFLGVTLALYTFMKDSIGVLPNGEKALREMLPSQFAWGLFVPALLLMAVPILEIFIPTTNSRPPKISEQAAEAIEA